MRKVKIPQSGTRFFMIMIIVTAAAGSGLCYLENGKVLSVTEALNKRQTEVGDEKTIRTKLEKVNLDLNAARNDMRYQEAKVNDAWYVPTLIKQLEKSATEKKLTLVSVRPAPIKREEPKTPLEENKKDDKNSDKPAAPKVERKPYQELDVQISVNGSFKDIMTFIDGLDTFPKILSVKQVQMNPHAATSGKDIKPEAGKMTLDCQITLRAFVFPQPTMTASSSTFKGEQNGR